MFDARREELCHQDLNPSCCHPYPLPCHHSHLVSVALLLYHVPNTVSEFEFVIGFSFSVFSWSMLESCCFITAAYIWFLIAALVGKNRLLVRDGMEELVNSLVVTKLFRCLLISATLITPSLFASLLISSINLGSICCNKPLACQMK